MNEGPPLPLHHGGAGGRQRVQQQVDNREFEAFELLQIVFPNRLWSIRSRWVTTRERIRTPFGGQVRRAITPVQQRQATHDYQSVSLFLSKNNVEKPLAHLVFICIKMYRCWLPCLSRSKALSSKKWQSH